MIRNFISAVCIGTAREQPRPGRSNAIRGAWPVMRITEGPPAELRHPRHAKTVPAQKVVKVRKRRVQSLGLSPEAMRHQQQHRLVPGVRVRAPVVVVKRQRVAIPVDLLLIGQALRSHLRGLFYLQHKVRPGTSAGERVRPQPHRRHPAPRWHLHLEPGQCGRDRCLHRIVVSRLARGAEQFGSRPQHLIGAVRIPILARGDRARIAEDDLRMRCRPLKRMPCSSKATVSEPCIEGAIAARGDRHHGGEIRTRTGRFVGRKARPDDLARQLVLVRPDERTKGSARLLMPDPAIRLILHLQHPLQIPPDLRKVVRQPPPGLRDAKRQPAQSIGIKLPGPQQRAARNAGVHHVAAVVPRIVPASVVRYVPLATARHVVFAMPVARAMFVAVAKIHLGSAALTIEGPHGKPQPLGIRLLRNGKHIATHCECLYPVSARNPQRRKVGITHQVAGCGIEPRHTERPTEDDSIRLTRPHLKHPSSRAGKDLCLLLGAPVQHHGRNLFMPRQIAKLVAEDRTHNRAAVFLAWYPGEGKRLQRRRKCRRDPGRAHGSEQIAPSNLSLQNNAPRNVSFYSHRQQRSRDSKGKATATEPRQQRSRDSKGAATAKEPRKKKWGAHEQSAHPHPFSFRSARLQVRSRTAMQAP